MLYQVLQLTPEQINALPPAERDAIQQLVGFCPSVIHVVCHVWKADSPFLCFFDLLTARFRLLCLEEESVYGKQYHHLTVNQTIGRLDRCGLGSFWGLHDSHLVHVHLRVATSPFVACSVDF
jgi:hypothetical protein